MSTLAAIEAGGSKFVCAVTSESGQTLVERRIPTTTPDETLERLGAFFKEARAAHGAVLAAGIASFGPLDLDTSSATYGAITGSPKPGWSGVNLQSRVKSMLGVPVAINTDVVCAAIAEGVSGMARGLDSYAYVTVGTGIGVGVVSHGQPLAGHQHTEVGHIRVARPHSDLEFAGVCPFHHDCVEGLASGPAIEARWSAQAKDLPDGHPAWALEAEYIAALCLNLVYTVRPQRVIVGGGVFQRAALFPLVRRAFSRLHGDYALGRWERSESFIAPQGCAGGVPGLLGAVELAKRLALPGPARAAGATSPAPARR